MEYFLVIFGTVLAALFIVQLCRGQKYNSAVRNLDEKVYTMHDLYVVGFSWMEFPWFSMKGQTANRLKSEASFLHEPQYAEYYANVIWAQALTFGHLFLTITFLLATVMQGACVLILAAGCFMTVLAVSYSMTCMQEDLNQRTLECESQLPEVVSTMAILVNSGMVLRDVWHLIGQNGKGEIHQQMRKTSDDMSNGMAEEEAFSLFGKSINSTEIKKFTSALIQSMDKGGAELGLFLLQQSSELWNFKRQRMLQRGEKAATKLLLPIVLIFVGIMIIVITAAFAGSLF